MAESGGKRGGTDTRTRKTGERTGTGKRFARARSGGGGPGGKGGKGGAGRPAKSGGEDQLRRDKAAAKRPPGRASRDAAVAIVHGVLGERRPLDMVLGRSLDASGLTEARDRGFARMMAVTVLRRRGQVEALVGQFLDKGMPNGSGRLAAILAVATAQLAFLDTPAHAAISVAVDQVRADRRAARYAGLANAVLRRISERAKAIIAEQDPVALNVPEWIRARWARTYGPSTALKIAEASLSEPALDITTKTDAATAAATWASRLGGTVLVTGSIRITADGRVEELSGFGDGEWWVQDAAAALPARLLGDVDGRTVADLCAAPGGKTAQLAAAGARVTAVDQSQARLAILVANLERLGLRADVVEADVAQWQPGHQFDAVLLDAPCSATGTIRRHPDILHLKSEADIAALAAVQGVLIRAAARLVAPGGRLVYCTCSLEPEEGEARVEAFLAETPQFARLPVTAGEAGIAADMISSGGDLRTLPFHTVSTSPRMNGLDGFYAARLVRIG